VRVPHLSPAAYRRITVVAACFVAVIIVSGAAVRLTASGLGCPQWPNCDSGQLTARAASDSHQWIESMNRMFTGAVSIAVIVAVLGSLVRTPRRRDLVWLSWGLVAGVVAQAVLGGLAVLADLAPPFVMGHFLLSIVLLADAIVLVHRAGIPDDRAVSRGEPMVSHRVVVLGRVLLVLVSAVLFTGTVVTGAGPHSGGAPKDNVSRIDLPIPDAARIHGITVMVFLAAVLVMLGLIWQDRAPKPVLTKVTWLLVVLVAQAAVGYTQYFTDLPAGLVGVHVAGATAVFTMTMVLYLGLFRHPATTDAVDGPEASSGDAVLTSA
jgi:cytochrome c oxidase assembly protein subunit 15